MKQKASPQSLRCLITRLILGLTRTIVNHSLMLCFLPMLLGVVYVDSCPRLSAIIYIHSFNLCISVRHVSVCTLISSQQKSITKLGSILVHIRSPNTINARQNSTTSYTILPYYISMVNL
jgi:hypothetical protein